MRWRLIVASLAGLVLTVTGAGVAWASSSALPLSGRDAVAPATHEAASSAVPDVPFVTSVVPGGLSLLVSWDPDPAGEQVTSYSVTVLPAAGGVTPPAGCSGPFAVSVGGSNSAGLVEGLCTGVAYQARVSAANPAGSSAASAPVVPLAAQVPQAPLITSVFTRPGALVVSWTAPGDSGGKPLTGYTLKASAGDSAKTVTAAASATSATISGLANGTSYSLTLTASNTVGASMPADGAGTPAPAHPPGAPGQVTAAPDGSGAIVASWAPPADNGGDALTGYTISWQQVVPAQDGSGYVPAPGTSLQNMTAGASATSLTLGPADFTPAAALYAISVSASNSAGTSPSEPTASPVAPVTQISSATVVLSAANMAALGSDTPAASGDGSVLVWPAPAPAQVNGLATGQVLEQGEVMLTGFGQPAFNDEQARRCRAGDRGCGRRRALIWLAHPGLGFALKLPVAHQHARQR